MDSRNFTEVALACSVLNEKGYTFTQIADLVGWDVDRVEWLSRAGRDATLRGVLDGCDSIDAYTKLMCSSLPVRKAVVKGMGDGLVTKKLLAAASVLVQRRAKRNEKRKGE